jgi:hypothetical protein
MARSTGWPSLTLMAWKPMATTVQRLRLHHVRWLAQLIDEA